MSSGKKSKSEPKLLALPPPPLAGPPRARAQAHTPAALPPPPPPPPPFTPEEGDVVSYTGRGGAQLVTVHKIHRNGVAGEEPYYDVVMPDGNHRDTTLDRLSLAT